MPTPKKGGGQTQKVLENTYRYLTGCPCQLVDGIQAGKVAVARGASGDLEP